MKQSDIRVRIIEYVILIYSFLSILIGNSMLKMSTEYRILFERSQYIFILICIVCAVFFVRYTKKQLLVTIGLMFLFIINFLLTRSYDYLFTFLVIVGFSFIKPKTIVKRMFQGQLFGFLSVLLLNSVNIIPSRIETRTNGVFRESLGFWTSNNASMTYLVLFLMIIFLYHKKINVFLTILFMLAGTYLYMVTNSRTSYLLLIFSGTFFLFMKFLEKKDIGIKQLEKMTFIILIGCALFSYLTALEYVPGNGFFDLLNYIVSGRIYYGNYFLENYGLSLIGQIVNYNSINVQETVGINFKYLVLDNVYLRILINYGIVIFFILFFYLIKLIKIHYKKRDYSFFVPFICFLILGVIEQSAFSWNQNFLLLSGYYFYYNNRANNLVKT